ncbi:MAG: hypothetical protein HYW27_02435 [Candidatus Aenigmarchaeota archaeon]|nr:hypothetical protein [Candidatus Aenigmarchaeota archaeon]
MGVLPYLVSVCLLGCASPAPQWKEYKLTRKAMEVSETRDPSEIFYFSSRPISEEPDYAITVDALLEIAGPLTAETLKGMDANQDSVITAAEVREFRKDR